MFREVLYTQWKWGRAPVFFGTIAAFAIPILSIQRWATYENSQADVASVLMSMQFWGYVYPSLAVLMGLVMAVSAWAADHRGSHVYALMLPIPRWYFTLLRLGAGTVLLIPIVIALWFGALVAISFASIPYGLSTYAFGIVLRFAFALMIAYTCFAAISAGTNRAAGYVLTIVGGVLLAQLGISLVGFGSEIDLLGLALRVLFESPGPLSIFGGRWMLIDV